MSGSPVAEFSLGDTSFFLFGNFFLIFFGKIRKKPQLESERSEDTLVFPVLYPYLVLSYICKRATPDVASYPHPLFCVWYDFIMARGVVRNRTWTMPRSRKYAKASRRNWFNNHSKRARALQVKWGVSGGHTW